MTRNQKIALGCGGAGCLGLIVVAIAGCLIYFFAYRTPYSTNRNYNLSTNRNSNSNDSDFTTNRNDNSSSSSSSSDSSLSEDEKHRLYQAAGLTADAEVVKRVSVKIGLMNDDYTPRGDPEAFAREHGLWAISNIEFIQTINTPEKARAYVDANLPE